ncbi:MAG: hypothetical protein ACXU7H_00830 [Burkholderiaceae bacterium]
MMRDAVTVTRQVRRNALALPDRRAGSSREIYSPASERKLLRQIGDFSSSYQKKKIKGIFFAFTLICYSALCLVLFILNVHVVTFFSVGSLIILAQLFQCSFDFFEEGARTQRAYRAYLDGFSFDALIHLRKTEKLSTWSKYEIDQYLKSIS